MTKYMINILDILTTDGDIILGGLFPIHHIGQSERTCGSTFNTIPGYQYMESMLYDVDNINKRQDILLDIKPATIIYDTCESPTIAGDRTKEFIKVTLSSCTANGSQLAGEIGSAESTKSIIVANFLRVFRIPQISYASATAELSNKELYDHFFRTVPPSSFFAEAQAHGRKLGHKNKRFDAIKHLHCAKNAVASFSRVKRLYRRCKELSWRRRSTERGSLGNYSPGFTLAVASK